MPNSLGTLQASIIVQKALDLVFTKRPELSMISTDFSSANAALNQAVISRLVTIPTVNAFGTGATGATTTDVSVTINTHKEIHLAFTPTEMSGTARNIVDEQSEAIAVAIGNSFIDAIAATWVTGTYTNTPLDVASGWTYSNTIVPMRLKMQGFGIPEFRRFFVVNSNVYSAFLTDSLVVNRYAVPTDGIQTGVVPALGGFDRIAEYSALPNTGNMIGFAGTPDSLIIATRVMRNPSELTNVQFPGTWQVITNAQTGLSVLLTEWIDPDTAVLNYRVSWMYGIAKGNANNGVILRTGA